MYEPVPPCRINSDAQSRAAEADRSVLYGALLLARRPHTRIKPAIAEAVAALCPAVSAFLADEAGELAALALDYARRCGAEEFLLAKRAEYAAEVA